MPQPNQLHDYPWWVNASVIIVVLGVIWTILRWMFLGLMWILFRNGAP